MKNQTTTLALTCLLCATCCLTARGDGFKLPKLSNPFKKPATSSSTEPAPRSATGANLSDEEPADREASSFSLPKPRLPKFELPSFGRDKSESSTEQATSRGATTRQGSSRTTVTQQSRANHNHRSEPSTFDKFSQGTKSFFSKAKTTLMPWTKDTASTSSQGPGAPSGSRSMHSTRTNGSQEREASARSGFSLPWSKPKPLEQEQEINSATDFLKLDRPKYY